MSDIDNKLREVGDKLFQKGRNYQLGLPAMEHRDILIDFVAQIKRTFAEAGWISPEQVDEIGKKHQFYERFEKELNKVGTWAYIHEPRKEALEAAKRAAGLK